MTVSDLDAALADYRPIRCVLEMDADGQIAIIVKPGCSVDDVHEMLRILTCCAGHFDHLILVDADEDLLCLADGQGNR